LIEQSEAMEVVAVLAHELGHWANWDTTRQLLIAEVYLSAFFLCFSTFIENGSLYRSFGFMHDRPALIGFLLFNDVWQPVDHVIKWAMQVTSRRNEYNAGMPKPTLY
jgi:STE24 endopeptidase